MYGEILKNVDCFSEFVCVPESGSNQRGTQSCAWVSWMSHISCSCSCQAETMDVYHRVNVTVAIMVI